MDTDYIFTQTPTIPDVPEISPTEPTSDPTPEVDPAESAITQVWEDIPEGATESGLDVQTGATTPVEESYSLDYGEYLGGSIQEGMSWYAGAGQYGGQTRTDKEAWQKAALIGLGMNAMKGASGGSPYTNTGGAITTTLAAGYAGYQAAPYGAQFEREYMGGYSPGYAFSGFVSPILASGGARNDQEAREARGERFGMTGAGATAGLLTSGGMWQGAVAGAAGAQFAENPYTGKRGYQEEWKYNIKPVGQTFWQDRQVAYGGTPDKKGFLKGGTNIKNWGDWAKTSVPGMGGMGGGGKKPPSKEHIKKEVATKMATTGLMDLYIRDWWNTISEKGGEAGREYIKGGMGEGLSYKDPDEILPSWISQGKWVRGESKKGIAYDAEGKKVAASWMVPRLAALQQEYEKIGNKKDFWNMYMKDYNIYKEGGMGLKDKWHGKELYNIPSEISGMGFTEAFPDIDIPTDVSGIDWMQLDIQNPEEEDV